jgi:hypothetical protein
MAEVTVWRSASALSSVSASRPSATSSRPLASPASAMAAAMGGNRPWRAAIARDRGAPSLTSFSTLAKATFSVGLTVFSTHTASDRSSDRPAPSSTASSPTALTDALRTAAPTLALAAAGLASGPWVASMGVRPSRCSRSSASARLPTSSTPERRSPPAVAAR